MAKKTFTDLYILVKKKPHRCYQSEIWQKWMNESVDERTIGLSNFLDGTIVVTEFLGFDVAVKPKLGPMLFETYVEGGKHSGLVQGYKTWAEAADGHFGVCWLVKESFH
jgi:hypothetical protein